MNYKFLVLILLLPYSYSAKCRGIAFESGGSLGAYEAGVVYGLVHSLNPEQVRWDIVSGVSTGAVNTGAMSMFPVGQELEASEYMISAWKSLNETSVFRPWEEGYIYSLFYKPSLYDTTPLRSFLVSQIKNSPVRQVSILATNLETGDYEIFNETLGADLVEAIMSSAAPPLLFPPRHFRGGIYLDGACLVSLDTFSLVTRCLNKVESQADIELDLIFDHYSTFNDTMTKNWTSYDVFFRTQEIQSHDSSLWVVYNTMAAYPEVKFRYVLSPSEYLKAGLVPLDFSTENLIKEIDVGIRDAKNAIIKNGNPKMMLKNMHLKAREYNIVE